MKSHVFRATLITVILSLIILSFPHSTFAQVVDGIMGTIIYADSNSDIWILKSDASPELLYSMEDSNFLITKMGVSSDGKLLYILVDEQSKQILKVFDIIDRVLVKSIDVNSHLDSLDINDPVVHFLNPQISPDLHIVAIGEYQNNLVFRDRNSEEILWETESKNNFWIGDSSWDPESNKIAYELLGIPGPSPFLMIADINTKSNYRFLDLENAGVSLPISWSPTGQYIAFEACVYGSTPLLWNGCKLAITNSEIADISYLMDINETSSSRDGFIAWSPDGQYLLVRRDAQIIIMSLTGDIVRDIPNAVAATWGISVDNSNEQKLNSLIEEKKSLIDTLENPSISTPWFSLPSISSIDEQRTKDLIIHLSEDPENLSDVQIDAFMRLVLEERAIAHHLDDYTRISSAQSDVIVDSVKSMLSFKRWFSVVWDQCRLDNSMCDLIKNQIDKLYWRSLSSFGKVVINLLNNQLDDAHMASRLWDVSITGITNELDAGKTLQEILIDTSIEAGVTQIFLGKFISKAQTWVDKGVSTADIDDISVEKWPITGDSDRAESLVNEMIQKSGWEAEAAISRHDDFARGADVAQLAADMGDIASLGGVPYSQLVAISGRVFQISTNSVSFLWNGTSLVCVDYLASRSVEFAFDSEQSSDSCQDYLSQFPSSIYHEVQMVNYHPSVPRNHNIAVFHQQSQDYIDALEALEIAVTENDNKKIDVEINEVISASDQLLDDLDAIQTRVLQKDKLDPTDIKFLTTATMYSANQIHVYLALADAISASKTKEKPATSIEKVINNNIELTNTLIENSTKIYFPDTPITLVRISDVQGNGKEQGNLSVTLNNYGQLSVDSLLIDVNIDNGSPMSKTIKSLESGSSQTLIFNPEKLIPSPIRIELYHGDLLIDYWVGEPKIESVIQESPTIPPSKWRNIIIFGSLISIIALAALFAIRRRK